MPCLAGRREVSTSRLSLPVIVIVIASSSTSELLKKRPTGNKHVMTPRLCVTARSEERAKACCSCEQRMDIIRHNRSELCNGNHRNSNKEDRTIIVQQKKRGSRGGRVLEFRQNRSTAGRRRKRSAVQCSGAAQSEKLCCAWRCILIRCRHRQTQRKSPVITTHLTSPQRAVTFCPPS